MKALMLLGLLCLYGCGDESALITDPAFNSYIDQFIQDAFAHNKVITKDQINVAFMDKPINGLSYGVCENGQIRIVEAYWNARNLNNKQAILYHELGHCVLDRGHDNTQNTQLNIPNSVMNSNVERVYDYWEKNRDYYLRELFK